MAITAESLKDFEGTEAEKELLTNFVKTKYGFKAPEEVTALETKKNELLKEKKELKTKCTALESENSSLQGQIEDLQSSIDDTPEDKQTVLEKTAEIRRLTREKAELEKNLLSVQNTLDTTTKMFHTETIEKSILSAVGSLDLIPGADKLLISDLRGRALVETTGEKPEVFLTDSNGNQVAPTEYLQAWSETNKTLIKAPLTKGGGSDGNNGNSDSQINEPDTLFNDSQFN